MLISTSSWVPRALLKQELVTFPNHLSSPSSLSRIHVVQSISVVFCVISTNVCLVVDFLLAILLSVHGTKTSDYRFGIFIIFWTIYKLQKWGMDWTIGAMISIDDDSSKEDCHRFSIFNQWRQVIHHKWWARESDKILEEYHLQGVSQ